MMSFGSFRFKLIFFVDLRTIYSVNYGWSMKKKKAEKEGEIGGKEMAIENRWKLRP